MFRAPVLHIVGCALLVFALPLAADIPNATLSPVSNLQETVFPHNLAAGTGGKVWFSNERTFPHSVGYFTPADGKVTKFQIPCDGCPNGDRLIYIESIVEGPDGNLWFPYSYVGGDGSPLNNGNNTFVGRMTPAGTFTSFAMPTVDAFRRFVFATSGHSMITVGPDGNLWFTENSPGKVGKITTSGQITEFSLSSSFSSPSGIATGPDGNVWFTETAAGKIGRITPAGTISEFTVPKGTAFAASPFAITSASDGNLWFTDVSGQYGRVTPAGSVSTFLLDANSAGNFIVAGSDGKLYLDYFIRVGSAGAFVGRIAQIDPTSVSAASVHASAPGVFFEFPGGASGYELAAVPQKVYIATITIDGSNSTDGLSVLLFSGPTPTGPITYANKPYSPSTDDPVATATGELFAVKQPDIVLRNGPMPLYFQRYYASLLKSDGNLDAKIGDNWSHNFAWRLRTESDPNKMSVIDWRGRVIAFQKSGSAWALVQPSDVPFQLVQSGTDFLFGDPIGETVYTFGSGGALTRIEDTHGNALTLTYTSGLLAQVTDGLGRTLSFAYTSGRITTVNDGTRATHYAYSGTNLSGASDALGNSTTYAYSSGSRTTSETLPQGNSQSTQTFDSSGRVTTQISGLNNATNLNYGSGQTSITDAVGNAIKQAFASGTGSELTGLTDASNRTATIGSDSSGRRTTVSDRLGGQTSVVYDAASGKPTQITRADGTKASFAYGTRNFKGMTLYPLTRITEPDGTTTTFTYDANGNALMRTDRAGKTWTFTYNDRGQPLTATNPTGGVVTSTYNGDGTLASAKDSDTGTTTFAYDSFRRLTAVVHPDASKVQLGYDDDDRVVSITDENGRQTQFTYDKNGNVVKTTDPAGKVTQRAYNAIDLIASTTDRLGKTVNVAYNNLDLPGSITDPNGNTATFGYDPQHRRNTFTDSGGNRSSVAYDAEGVPSGATNPSSESAQIATNALGFGTSVTDPIGNVVNISRDDLQRVTAVRDPLGRNTAANYDNRGLVNRVTAPSGDAITIDRNDLGLPSKITDPNGGVWTRGYTAAGRPNARTDPAGRRTTNDFDSRGRLAATHFADGTSMSVTYDASGNVTARSYSNGGPNMTYTYDARGRLSTAGDVQLSRDDEGRVTNERQSGTDWTAAYDNAGLLSSAGFNNGALIVTYQYDARNLLTRVSDNLSNASVGMTYDPSGRLMGMTRSNGVNMTVTRDKDGRVTHLLDGAFINIQRSYDAAGQLVSEDVTEPLDPATVVQTASDNITRDSSGRPTGNGDAVDARGRIISTPSGAIAWDNASHPVSVGSSKLTWNALDQQVTRTDGEVTQSFFYSLGSLAEIRNEPTNQVSYFVDTPSGKPLYTLDAATRAPSFYHFDANGSTIAMTSVTGQVTDAYAYAPFGVLLGHQGPTTQPFTLLGAFGIRSDVGLPNVYLDGANVYDARSGTPANKWEPDEELIAADESFVLGNGAHLGDGVHCVDPGASTLGDGPLSLSPDTVFVFRGQAEAFPVPEPVIVRRVVDSQELDPDREIAHHWFEDGFDDTFLDPAPTVMNTAGEVPVAETTVFLSERDIPRLTRDHPDQGELFFESEATRPGFSNEEFVARVLHSLEFVALLPQSGAQGSYPLSFSFRRPKPLRYNVLGIEPTVGLTSRGGVVPVSHTQDTVGPHARTVADAAAILNGIELTPSCGASCVGLRETPAKVLCQDKAYRQFIVRNFFY